MTFHKSVVFDESSKQFEYQRKNHNLSSFGLSALSLRFQDRETQNEFISYLREDVYKQTRIIVLILVLIIVCFLTLLSLNDTENEIKLLAVLCAQFGCVTLPLLIALLNAGKHKCIVEIFGISLLVPYIASVYVIYLAPPPSIEWDE